MHTGLTSFLPLTGEEGTPAAVLPLEGVVLPECTATLDWRGLCAGVKQGELSLLLLALFSLGGYVVFRICAYEKVFDTTVAEGRQRTSVESGLTEQPAFDPSVWLLVVLP